MPRVIISSGHTSANPGVVLNGLQEYELARKIAKYALKYIRANGIISLSVPPNLELPQRIAWINKTGYLRETNDIAIEMHINDGGNSGIEAWFEGDGANPSQGIANIVVDSLSRETGLPILGVRSEFNHELGSITFVHEVKPYSVVIECGYIDGDAEFLKVEENLEKCGRGIAKGILNYFGLEFRELPQGNATLITTPQQSVAVPQTQSPVETTVPVVTATPMNTGSTLRAQSDDYDEEYDDYDDIPSDFTPQTNQHQPPKETIPQAVNTTPTNMLNNYAAPQPINSANNYGGFNGYNQQVPTTGTSGGAYPSREERKEMIVRNYEKILGHEPNQNDLNYFLNIGIKEDELIRKMVDSQEHVDLVAAKEQLAQIKLSFESNQTELAQLRSLTEDQKNILDQYNQSIEQKNIALSKLQYDLKEAQQKLHQEPVSISKKKSVAKGKFKLSFKDKFYKAMSDLLE